MREFVGTCETCKKDIYCENGFLNGQIDEEKKLRCFECGENEKNE